MAIIKSIRYSLRHVASYSPEGKSFSTTANITLVTKKAAIGDLP